MAFEITTEIKINASSKQVWSVLTNFNNYPNWNPFITSLKGDVYVGNTIEVNLLGMKMKPKVLAFNKNQEFRWLGHLFIKGLFDGEHRFVLNQNNDGSTTLIHSEKFYGILVPLFKKSLLGKVKDGFKQMNVSVKNRTEELLSSNSLSV
jgi:hypothetical protein